VAALKIEMALDILKDIEFYIEFGLKDFVCGLASILLC